MQVKTFTGTSTQAVLAQIKAELGPDAVILSTQHCRTERGNMCEMTAGVERTPAAASNGNGAGGNGNGNGNGGIAENGLPAGWSEWHREWSIIKEHLVAMARPGLQLERLSPRQRIALEYLQREGVDETVILGLYRKLLPTPGASVLEALAGMVPVQGWSNEAWPQRVHLFAGPYGAGKTTSALRMALALRKENPALRIAVINADAARGNGRLVLRHWAELSDLAYHEASDNVSMAMALAASMKADRVFIDLPGLARNDTLPTMLASLGLDAVEGAVHLVLPPHHGPAQLTAFLKQYRCNLPGSIIWTKLDEACSFGALVNVGTATGLPVSALSFGPGLRETLAPARDVLLWRLVFKRQLPGEAAASGTAAS